MTSLAFAAMAPVISSDVDGSSDGAGVPKAAEDVQNDKGSLSITR